MSALDIRQNFDGLALRVDAAGGAISVQMGDLRDLVQAGRLAAGPVAQIEHNLEQAGLAATNPTTSQWDWTLVYRTSSPVGRVIDAAAGRSEHSHADLFNAINAVTAPDDSAAEELESLRATVDQIRALIVGA